MKLPLRDDLALAAYAVCNGFELRGKHASEQPRFVAGIPPDGLMFVKGNWTVWETARGWRAARMIDGLYEMATPEQFFLHLLDALDHVLSHDQPTGEKTAD